jgi:hypothetical protein
VGNPINCDYVGTVDFGDGPVQVRCTETGPHDEHKVEVLLGATVPREGYVTKNVFDDEGDASGG